MVRERERERDKESPNSCSSPPPLNHTNEIVFPTNRFYVGKRKLESGIKAYKAAHPDSVEEDTFTVEWFPFYLVPDAPETGASLNERLDKIFGPEKRVAVQARLSAIGREQGINFKYGGLTGNTRNSHRIVQLAKTKGAGVQDRVVDALFSAYFENEQDITSKKVLREAALKGGLEAGEVDDVLASDRFGTLVDREVEDARRNLVTSVPHFILNDKYEIGGAQDSDGFKRVFEKIKEMES